MVVRRRLIDEPTSRLAVWARRLALFSLTATVLAIIIVRADFLEIRPALATVAGAMSLAMFAIVLAIGALAVIWKEGTAGFGYAIVALLLGLMILAYPVYLAIKGYHLPAISDITTDPIDPPSYEVVARLRTRDSNPTLYAGLYAAEQQRAAYPDVQPLFVQTSPQAAYEAAIAVANKRKWHVINARPPEAGKRDGYIEMVARTPIMGFRDDVAVRVRANSAAARVDVRSSSRYGRYDFGTNAARIRGFLDDLDETITSHTPERSEKPDATAPQNPARRPPPRR
jgi:uncharacterized protein (DUF1499 family)